MTRALLWIPIALTGLGASPRASAQDFEAPWIGYDTSVYPEGHLSNASQLADFDGDGVLDMAVSSWHANSQLSILIGDG